MGGRLGLGGGGYKKSRRVDEKEDKARNLKSCYVGVEG